MYLLDAMEVLNYNSSNMNIQPDVSVATTSHNIDTQYGKEQLYDGLTLDNNSNDKILSSSVDNICKLNCSIFIILNYKHDSSSNFIIIYT